MAACGEIMSFSETSFLTISGPLLRRGNHNKHCLAFPVLYPDKPGRGRRLRPAKTMPTPVKAATNEDVVKMMAGKQAKMDKVMLRAALTVRRKHKEDIKEAVVNQLDALTDRIGWNVALELISTEINPSKPFEILRCLFLNHKPQSCLIYCNESSHGPDMLAESRVEKPHPIYVPRDEAFEELKQGAFTAGRLKAVLHNFIPSLIASISADNHDFKGFHHIDNLYKEGLILKLGLQEHLFKKLPFVKKIQESSEGLLRYDTPSILTKDKFAWLRDDEFARQAVAGINPVSIERLQAVEEEKLFMLDFYDICLPFVDRINVMDGRKAYATRTLFFLTPIGTLKPIAIELGLPPQQPGASRPSVVLTPPRDATSNWLWMLGKAHVCSNDAGVHQLVNHWLRTHASMEPFIIAAHRQLSVMHPVFKLLHPHMRYTLEINALARQNLINADGVIESCFTPGPIGMEMSAAFYKHLWRFDLEGLPADLIRRGMAVADATQPHGLRVILPDYPYADDGLLLWSAIARFVSSYVRIYYPDSEASRVRSDSELQAWYHECVNEGHADHRHASWWPRLDTPDDLVALLTTLIWLASAQHAALNFGQYPLGGYVPSRPPLMRRLIPDPERDADEFRAFLADPHCFFLSALPSVLQATKFMAVVDTLSTHSPDEEYLGETRDGTAPWTADEEAAAAYRAFAAEVAAAQDEIDRRNADTNRRNRCGAGVLPYELMAPSSGPGVTGRGVPNSVSI